MICGSIDVSHKKYRTGFVCSSFDIIHPGYILLLKEAKSLCDKVIVGLHSDPSIERSWKNSPVQSLEERKIVLEAISYVDGIVVYDTEKDLLGLLTTINPDVRILGTDYKHKESFTGKELNIPVHFHERNHNWSTTNLKKRIIEKGIVG